MNSRNVAQTSRRVACPTCRVARFEHCLDRNGNPTVKPCPARAAAARDALPITPGHVEMLRRLHVDPTRHIEPGMRIWLLSHKLVASIDPPTPPGERRARVPKRRHPLTEAGRALIGVTAPATG